MGTDLCVHACWAGAHEECERLERLIVQDFRTDAKGHAERLAQGHRVRKMLDQMQSQAEKLVRPYMPAAGSVLHLRGPFKSA